MTAPVTEPKPTKAQKEALLPGNWRYVDQDELAASPLVGEMPNRPLHLLDDDGEPFVFADANGEILYVNATNSTTYSASESGPLTAAFQSYRNVVDQAALIMLGGSDRNAGLRPTRFTKSSGLTMAHYLDMNRYGLVNLYTSSWVTDRWHTVAISTPSSTAPWADVDKLANGVTRSSLDNWIATLRAADIDDGACQRVRTMFVDDSEYASYYDLLNCTYTVLGELDECWEAYCDYQPMFYL